MQCSLQPKRTAQSMDSLQSTTRLHRKSTEWQPRQNQVLHMNQSLHKLLGVICPVTINGKTHPLPTTKEYILHEYADVFKGVGTLPGGPYCERLKTQNSISTELEADWQSWWSCKQLPLPIK